MKNNTATGDVIVVTAPYAVASGAGCLVGSLFGVASTTAAISTPVALELTGVFTLAKVTGAAWTVGQRLYWDDTAKNVTGTASTNKLIGVAVAAAASADTTGSVRLTAAFTL